MISILSDAPPEVAVVDLRHWEKRSEVPFVISFSKPDEAHGVGSGVIFFGHSSPLDGPDDFGMVLGDESPSVVSGIVEHPCGMSLRLNARSPSMFVAVFDPGFESVGHNVDYVFKLHSTKLTINRH